MTVTWRKAMTCIVYYFYQNHKGGTQRKFVHVHIPGGAPVQEASEVAVSQFWWSYPSPLLREEVALRPSKWDLGPGCPESHSSLEDQETQINAHIYTLMQSQLFTICFKVTVFKYKSKNCLTVLIPWLHMVEHFGKENWLVHVYKSWLFVGAGQDSSWTLCLMSSLVQHYLYPRRGYCWWLYCCCSVLSVCAIALTWTADGWCSCPAPDHQCRWRGT